MTDSTQPHYFRLKPEGEFTEERIFCPEGNKVAYYVTPAIAFRLDFKPQFVRKLEKEIAEYLEKLAGRITTPRKMVCEHDKKEFEYPFGYLGEWQDESDGWGESVFRPIPHLPSPPLGDFPKNISRWIWSAAGCNDGDPWDLLAELDDENGKRYVYYTAWCDYTGFDCQGGHYVTTASSIESLIEYAMENRAYKRYINTTEPAESWV